MPLRMVSLPQNYPGLFQADIQSQGHGCGQPRVASPEDYAEAYQPGHFWCPLLQGEHVSSDVALRRRRAAAGGAMPGASPPATAPSTIG